MHTFETTDRDGNAHSWIVTPHPPSRGVPLMMKLQGLSLEPIAEALKAITSMPGAGAIVDRVGPGGKLDLQDEETMRVIGEASGELIAAVQGLDAASVARSLREVMLYPGGDKLIRAMLSEANRDGKPVAKHFDEMFVRNYGEMFAALMEVVTYNDFLPLVSLFLTSDLAEAWKEIQAALTEDLEEDPSPASPPNSSLPVLAEEGAK